MTSEGNDPRTQLAINYLSNYRGVLKIHKSTRSGATTSLCISSISLEKKFLAVEPTNKIIKETIKKDIPKYSNKPDANIIHIPANIECEYNKQMIAENPDYGLLQSLPIDDNCNECEHYKTCPITEILRLEDFDGIVITYDKMIAVQRAAELYPKSKAAEILEKICSVKFVILDEAHELAFPDITKMEYKDTCKDVKNLVEKIKLANKENRKQKHNMKKFPILETIELMPKSF